MKHSCLEQPTPPRIAAIVLNGIGDHYFTIPALRALKMLSNNQVRVIGARSVARHVFQSTEFDDVHEIADSNKEGVWEFDEEPIKNLLCDRDIVVSFCTWSSQQLLRVLSESGALTIAFVDPLADQFLSRGFMAVFDTDGNSVQRLEAELPSSNTKRALDSAPTISISSRIPLHSFDLAFKAVQSLDSNLDIEQFNSAPRLCDEGEALAVETIRSARDGNPLLVIHTETKSAKMWTSANWAKLCLRMRKDYPSIAIACIDLREPQGELGDLFRSDKYCVHAPMQPLSVGAGLISGAVAFVGIDSYPLHVADLFRIPSVGLFRCTSAKKYGIRFGKSDQNIYIGDDEAHVDNVFNRLSTLIDMGKPIT